MLSGNSTPQFSFRLSTGAPEEETWQSEPWVPTARVREGQSLRGRLLPGPVLGHRKELGGLGGQRGRGGAGGTTTGMGGQRSFCDGDSWREGADLAVGGLLGGAFILSHLVHGHVFTRTKGERLGSSDCLLYVDCRGICLRQPKKHIFHPSGKIFNVWIQSHTFYKPTARMFDYVCVCACMFVSVHMWVCVYTKVIQRNFLEQNTVKWMRFGIMYWTDWDRKSVV